MYHYCSIQTLTTLNLRGNQIDDKGAEHIAHALQSNVVRELLLSSITYSYHYRSIQTLTTLNLVANIIGNKGVQYLSNTKNHLLKIVW